MTSPTLGITLAFSLSVLALCAAPRADARVTRFVVEQLTLGGLIAAVTFSPCEARLTQLVISPTEIVGGGADIGAAAVPEPAAGAMLVVGLVLLAAAERRLPRTA